MTQNDTCPCCGSEMEDGGHTWAVECDDGMLRPKRVCRACYLISCENGTGEV